MTLSNSVLKAIKDLREVITEDITGLFVTKMDISQLAFKDEFYKKIDGIMGELKTIRKRQEI